MAPRSAADATRFTATGPYASKMAPPSASARSGESPNEKVARLRAAAAKARLDQVSGMDKVVTTGRSVADRLHRFAALGLMGLTGKSNHQWQQIYFRPI
jgi:hypothetical protein